LLSIKKLLSAYLTELYLVLDRMNWNKSQAAQILGIERSTLDRKLKRYQVSRPGS